MWSIAFFWHAAQKLLTPPPLFSFCSTKPTGVKDLDANFAEIPWQAMILRESSKTLLCGGAIIGDEFVLTSASCVNG